MRLALAVLLILTGAIHLALTPEHFTESTAMGIGFVVAGIAQLAAAVLILLRPQRPLYVAVALASVVLVGLYCYNVLVGLPFAGSPMDEEAGGLSVSGIQIGSGEAVDLVGASNLAIELLCIALAALLVMRPRSPMETALQGGDAQGKPQTSDAGQPSRSDR